MKEAAAVFEVNYEVRFGLESAGLNHEVIPMPFYVETHDRIPDDAARQEEFAKRFFDLARQRKTELTIDIEGWVGCPDIKPPQGEAAAVSNLSTTCITTRRAISAPEDGKPSFYHYIYTCPKPVLAFKAPLKLAKLLASRARRQAALKVVWSIDGTP